MATPENKRKADEGDGAAAANGPEAKKPRLGSGAEANGGAEAQLKADNTLSVLDKARKALEMQKVLKERLQRMRQQQPAAAAAAAPAGPARPPSKQPPPLVLDSEGREVGKAPAPPAAPPKAPLQLLRPDSAAEELDERFFDPEVGGRGAHRAQRRPRPELRFVEQGKFQKQAETNRLRAEFGDDYVKDLAQRRRQEKASAAAGGDANLVPLGERPEAAEAPAPAAAVPDVEWWDARILEDKTSYGDAAEGVVPALRLDRITHYVEHPPPLEPPAEAPPPPPQPLRLTKRELRKLRTQRRQAREQEKQELLRQGLLEPPKPKVKISNLMRVLGAEAAADPTAIESEVRRQMAERAAAHEDRNLARMLTPAERRDKKLRKLLDNPPPPAAAAAAAAAGTPAAPLETHVAVYKVADFSAPRLRFKVVVNAQENHMSGAAVVAAGAFSLVIVEGGPKTLRRYEKLMLRRINWDDGREEEEGEAEGGAAARAAAGRAPNSCRLVWQGVVKEPAFKGKFKTLEMPTVAAAKKVLDERGVGHYWDLAAALRPE